MASGRDVVPATMVVKGESSAVNLELTYDFQILTSPDWGVIETTHSDLKFQPYKDLGGTVGNAQRLKFTLDLLGQAR